MVQVRRARQKGMRHCHKWDPVLRASKYSHRRLVPSHGLHISQRHLVRTGKYQGCRRQVRRYSARYLIRVWYVSLENVDDEQLPRARFQQAEHIYQKRVCSNDYAWKHREDLPQSQTVKVFQLLFELPNRYSGRGCPSIVAR